MRLLGCGNDGELSLLEAFGSNIPRYAILSHTWGADNEEVGYRDIIDGTGKSKAGYSKVQFCRQQAANDGLEFFWVDTCCIDKSSSAELSEAINSMFQWYHNATKCYVYLSDVSIDHSVKDDSQWLWIQAFRKSRWFVRGWTLQELLAPRFVEFFSAEGMRLGGKHSLAQQIHDITGISMQALRGSPCSEFSIDERMSWSYRRETKREEDAAYSLLGIFDIHMPLIYGEGRRNAFTRLQKEIRESLSDGRESDLNELSKNSAARSQHLVYMGDVNYKDKIDNNYGVVMGHAYSIATDGNRITGSSTTNYYGFHPSDTKASIQ